MNEEQTDNGVDEKLRLFYKGHTCAEQQKFTEALNHWEEAVEIVSYIPSSMASVFNGAIYIQMAAAYFRMNNLSEALTVMEKGLRVMDSYYPPTHRMFAGLGFLYGYHLLLNEQSTMAIGYLEKSQSNPYFSNDREYLSVVYSLLGLSYIHSGNLNQAEEILRKALLYRSPTNLANLVAPLLEELPQWKIIAKFQDPDYPRRSVLQGLQLGQQLLALLTPQTNISTASINEENSTCDELIVLADSHRHRNDQSRAEKYYKAALEKTTETDGKQVWQIYRKMMRRAQHDVSRYQDYFIEQYSRYGEENPNHFQIIATLRIIMSKLYSDQLAFDCLIHGVLLQIKSWFVEISLGSLRIWDLLARLIRQDQMSKFLDLLTALMKRDPAIGPFLLKSVVANDFAPLLYHSQLDRTLEELSSRYSDDPSATSMVIFLQTSLRILRQSVAAPETSTLPLKDEILKFLSTYTDPDAPLFHLMKAVESLLLDDGSRRFLDHLDRLQRGTFTFERYVQLKESLSRCFASLEEDQLRMYFQQLATNL